MSEVVEKSKQSAVVQSDKPTTERWVSAVARSHMITGRDAAGNLVLVKMDNYGVSLDLNDPADLAKSQALKSSGKDGTVIFKVGGAYPESDIGKRTELLRRLRDMLNGDDQVTAAGGLAKLRALFTEAEMKKAGLSRVTEDVDALIMLAIQTKSLGDLK